MTSAATCGQPESYSLLAGRLQGEPPASTAYFINQSRDARLLASEINLFDGRS